MRIAGDRRILRFRLWRLASFNGAIFVDPVFMLGLPFLHQVPLNAEQSIYLLTEYFNFVFGVHEVSLEGLGRCLRYTVSWPVDDGTH